MLTLPFLSRQNPDLVSVNEKKGLAFSEAQPANREIVPSLSLSIGTRMEFREKKKPAMSQPPKKNKFFTSRDRGTSWNNINAPRAGPRWSSSSGSRGSSNTFTTTRTSQAPSAAVSRPRPYPDPSKLREERQERVRTKESY